MWAQDQGGVLLQEGLPLGLRNPVSAIWRPFVKEFGLASLPGMKAEGRSWAVIHKDSK